MTDHVSTTEIVTDEPRFAEEAGFNIPVVLSVAVAALVIPTKIEAVDWGQDTKGRLWDVLHMARLYRTRPMPPRGASWTFPCIFRLAGAERAEYAPHKLPARRILRLRCTLGPDSNGEPTATIKLAREGDEGASQVTAGRPLLSETPDA